MTRLAWGAHGERFFETGTDRGVLYLSGKAGVPWNGLKAVNESVTGGDAKPFYIDGYKYLNVSSYEEFSATIEAFSAPHEFGVCDGTVGIHNGLFATEQPRVEFGLSYRTLIGNDQDGIDHGYKIHLVYNALAAPSTRNRQSVGGGVNILGLGWSITTQPPLTTGIRPTAHFVIDSRRTPSGLLKTIEDILYGTNATEPRLPTVDELRTMFTSNGPLLGRNLFTNPSFEAGSGQVTVYQNLFTNPSFEATSGVVELRRNYVLSPFGTTALKGYASQSTHETVEGGVSTSGWPALPTGHPATALRLTIPASAPVGGGVILTDAAKSLPAGDYILSMWVLRSSGPATSLQSALRGIRGFGTARTFTYGQWTYVEEPFTVYASESTTGAVIGWRTTVTDPVVSSFLVANMQIAPATQAVKQGELVVSGSGSGYDSDMTPSWVGVPDGSASILTGVGVDGVGLSSAPCAHVASTQWSSSPTKSLRSIPLSSTTNDTFATLGGDAGAMRLGMQAGKTYTLSATLRLVSPQTGTLSTSARRLRPMVRQADGGYVSFLSDQAPNVPGVHRLSRTFTIPVGSTEAFIRLQNGATAGGGEVWWDDVVLIEGVYTGSYFDGNTLPAIHRNRYIPARIGFGSNSGDTALVISGPYSGGYLPVTPGEKISFTTFGAAGNRRQYGFSATLPTNLTQLFGVVNQGNGSGAEAVDVVVPPGAAYMAIYVSNLNEDTKVFATSAQTDPFRLVFDGSTGRVEDGYETAWEGIAGASASYVYDPDFTVAWSGTPHASTSKVTGVQVKGLTSNGCIAIRSTRWSKSGPYSIRLIASSIYGDAYAEFIPPGTPQLDGHTIMATRYQTDAVLPMIGVNERGRGIYTIWESTAGVRVKPMTNESGEEILRGSLVGTGRVQSMRLYHGGGQGSGDVWWDCAGLFEGDYKGPWFDGNSVEDGHTFVWLGEPDQSVSEHYSWYF